jgi:hypothetical protein
MFTHPRSASDRILRCHPRWFLRPPCSRGQSYETLYGRNLRTFQVLHSRVGPGDLPTNIRLRGKGLAGTNTSSGLYYKHITIVIDAPK